MGQAARALENDDRDSGWNGPVAIEHSDGPRPLTGPWAALSTGAFSPGLPPSPGHTCFVVGGRGSAPANFDHVLDEGCSGSSRLGGARQSLRTAIRALQTCDSGVRSVMEKQQRQKLDSNARKEAATLVEELGDARAELAQLKRELQRLRGVPEELTALPTSMLHSLHEKLCGSLRNAQVELESRTKCCICREVERQVLLRPCQHLALCNACARRVDKCPLCRSNIERYEVVCVA